MKTKKTLHNAAILGPSSLKYSDGRPLVRLSDKTIEVGGHFWTTYTPADDEMSDEIFEYCADCGRMIKTQ